MCGTRRGPRGPTHEVWRALLVYRLPEPTTKPTPVLSEGSAAVSAEGLLILTITMLDIAHTITHIDPT